MKNIKKNYIFFGILLITAIFGYTFFQKKQIEYRTITSYKECIKAGYPISSTYPEVCKLPGKNFPNPNQLSTKASSTVMKIEESLDNFLTIPYLYNGESFMLFNKASSSLPLQATSSSFFYTGVNYSADVNKDSLSDTILLLTYGKSLATTVAPYYIATAIKLYSGVVGSNILYIDKNISTSTLLFKNGMIYVSYKKENSTSTTEKHYIFENDILKERR